MKKIALLLAMLLCLVPVFSACSMGTSGAEKVVKNYLEAIMKDFDKDAAYEAVFYQNKEILEVVLSEDLYDAVTAEGWRDETDKQIKNEKKYANDADDYDFSYEIYDSRAIEIDSDEYDALVEEFSVIINDDVEDAIEGIALVRAIYDQVYTMGDEEYLVTEEVTFLCVEIEGDWYILSVGVDYGTYSEQGSLTAWLDD